MAAGCTSGKGSYGGGGGSPSLGAAVASQGSFSSGEQGASYTITVSNTGTAATTGTVTVVDPPTGFTVTAISGGATWTCTLATTTCTYSNSVGAGQSFPPITVTGNVTAANGTPVSIPLSLSGGGASAVNVTPTPTVTVAAVALGITKSHTGNFTQGQQGETYTAKVSNGANAGATSGMVTVTEIPPAGLTVTGMAGTNWACVVATLTCTRSDSLAGGASYENITITLNVSATAISPQNNQVTVSGGGSANANATDPTAINPGGVSACPLPALGSEGQLNGTFTILFNGWNDSPGGPSQAAAAFIANGAGSVTSGEMDLGAVGVGVTSQSAPVLVTISSGCYQLGSDERGLMTWNLTGGRGPVTFAFSARADINLGSLIEFDDANPSTTPGTRGVARLVQQTGGPFTQVFSGPWDFGLTGYSPNGSNTDYHRSGAVGRFDNSAVGVVSNGAVDVGFANDGGTQTNVDNQSFTGSFTAPDSLGRGTLTLNFTNFNGQGPLTLNFAYYAMDSADLWVQSIDTPDNNRHSLENGDVVKQFGPFGPGSLSGNSVFNMSGADLSTSHSFTVIGVGQVNGDGLGGASVKLDEVSNGSVVATGTNTISGGSFAVLPNGMGVLTFGTGSTAKWFSVAMDGPNSGWLLEGTQASPGSNVIFGGFVPQRAPAGGFVDGTFSGLHNIGSFRVGSPKSDVEVGSLTATTTTSPASFSGKMDHSSGAGCNTGCLATDQPISATYSVDANGRIVITFGAGTGGGTAVGRLRNQGRTAVILSDISDANGTVLGVH